MPTDFPVLNKALIVNDESNDSSAQLAPGEEALDGDGNAVVTVVRSTAAPTAADIRPYGQFWLRTTNQALYWSRGGGLWYQFRDAASIPAHQLTHLANGDDALPWTMINGRGLLTARPAAAAANAGYFYDATDAKRLYRSNGTAWEVVAGTDAASEYIHIQGVAATAWAVAHNLGRFPKSIAVRDSGNMVCMGGVLHVDTNNLTITFGHAFSGTATVG